MSQLSDTYIYTYTYTYIALSRYLAPLVYRMPDAPLSVCSFLDKCNAVLCTSFSRNRILRAAKICYAAKDPLFRSSEKGREGDGGQLQLRNPSFMKFGDIGHHHRENGKKWCKRIDIEISPSLLCIMKYTCMHIYLFNQKLKRRDFILQRCICQEFGVKNS